MARVAKRSAPLPDPAAFPAAPAVVSWRRQRAGTRSAAALSLVAARRDPCRRHAASSRSVPGQPAPLPLRVCPAASTVGRARGSSPPRQNAISPPAIA